MTTKLVVRLLDATQSLLGWTEVQAIARGDGQLWCNRPVVAQIDVSGTVAFVSIHWADVNVETRTVLSASVMAGQQLIVFPSSMAVLRIGPMPGFLPSVTVRSPIGIVVPHARLGTQSVANLGPIRTGAMT